MKSTTEKALGRLKSWEFSALNNDGVLLLVETFNVKVPSYADAKKKLPVKWSERMKRLAFAAYADKAMKDPSFIRDLAKKLKAQRKKFGR